MRMFSPNFRVRTSMIGLLSRTPGGAMVNEQVMLYFTRL
jgi:hypothetical protein